MTSQLSWQLPHTEPAKVSRNGGSWTERKSFNKKKKNEEEKEE